MIDPRLHVYYEKELKHIREMAGEFARAFPKIADRFGLNEFECADPYVERLLEGFAYLAARVQLKVDAEFPKFTSHLLEMVYPHYLAPIPSMLVVQFQPDLNEGSLADGFVIPREETILRSRLVEQTSCQYRTAHDVTLWPVKISKANYLFDKSAVVQITGENIKSLLNSQQYDSIQAAIRLRLETTASLAFNELKLDRLPLYLRGVGKLPMQIYEQLLSDSIAMIIQPAGDNKTWQHCVKENSVIPKGFNEDEALLPYTPRSFQGYRLLQEYFSFPGRYMFAELTQLQDGIKQCTSNVVDIVILLKRKNANLSSEVNESRFALFCSPAINLFEKTADAINLNEQEHEYHVVPDRSRPLDYEVYQIQGMTGTDHSLDEKQEFFPFYQANANCQSSHQAYYAVSRVPRLAPRKHKQSGSRSSYIGSEVFISIVDRNEAPYRSDLRQLAIKTLCTNRDLSIQLAMGKGKTDFSIQISSPVETIIALTSPTHPRPSIALKDTAWKIINHLSLNYLSLINNDQQNKSQAGAYALRDLLSLYVSDRNDNDAVKQQIEGIVSIESKPIIERVHAKDPIAFARGLEITITVDENLFKETGVFLFGMVLEHFFSQYVSINSFTKMILRTEQGHEIYWPVRFGKRQLM